MSADLLAAFGSSKEAEWSSHENPILTESQPNQPRGVTPTATRHETPQSWPHLGLGRTTSPNTGHEELWQKDTTGADILFDAEFDSAHTNGEDDDFGEFEDAAIPAGQLMPISRHEGTLAGGEGDLLGLEELVMERTPGPTTDVPLQTTSPLVKNTPVCKSRPEPAQAPPNSNVMVTDDDWGDFEDFEKVQEPSVVLRAQASKAGGFQSPKRRSDIPNMTKKPLKQPAMKTSQARLAGSTQTTARNDDFDQWDDFDDIGASTVMKTENLTQSAPTAGIGPELKVDRPTNVPPPAILLQTLPKVYLVLVKLVKQSPEDRSLGESILDAFRVTARIIAGRAARWKRDTILAQSMRMGAAGRSGGMKLTSIDRSESRREEQEVAEAIGKWSQCSLMLNSAMVKAKVQKPTTALNSNMLAKAVSGPGVMTASHVCPLCGLKRDERIQSVDADVVDALDEFWIEFWGHKDCRSVWYFCQQNDLLDHR